MSKRKRQAILFFTYGFMTLATLVLSAVCLLLVLGYRFDVNDGKIEQGGLIQFRSTPGDAAVTIDGKRTSFTTPGKSDVTAGSHSVAIQKTGYYAWQKTVNVDAGELRWLNYARLVPEKITTKTRSAAEGVTAARPSPDRKYVVALAQSKPLTVMIYDIRDISRVSVKSYPIPDGLLTQQPDQASTLAVVEWDIGSRYVLLRHMSGNIEEYIRIDRTAETGAPYNLTKEFNLAFRSVHFSGGNGNVFYALTDRDIRRIDVDAKSVSQPLISGVESYQLYHNSDIGFVALRADKRVAGVYIDSKEAIVRSFEASEPVHVDLTDYFSHRYLAIASKNHVTIYKDPVASTNNAGRSFAALTLPYDVSWVDFASSGRFLIAGSGLAYGMYDLETDEQSLVHTQAAAADMSPTWIDDYYLADNPSGTVRLYEFDGTNSHDIVTAERTLPAFLNEDGKYLMSFGHDKDKLVLRSSQMVLD